MSEHAEAALTQIRNKIAQDKLRRAEAKRRGQAHRKAAIARLKKGQST